jgi:hypothetical protein
MNPYLIIGLIVAWLASLAGVGYWQNDAGHVAERTTWQTRENGELRAANDKIKTLEEDHRKAEHDHAAAVAAISTDYERKLSDANKQRASDAAAVHAGTLRLRDPNPTGFHACGGVGIQIGTGSGRRDGGAPGELSAATSGFLLELANDADDVARQLAACQAVVVKDRELR